jgi:hypothetical protein
MMYQFLIPPPLHGATAPSGPGPPHYEGFTITLRHTTLGRAPLDELSARRKDLYPTTHNTQKRQASMSPAGFEPAIPAYNPRLRSRGHRDQLSFILLSINYVGPVNFRLYQWQ